MSIGKIILGIFVLGTILVVSAMFYTVNEPPRKPGMLPWEVTPTADGSSRVFGLTLGKSNLNDAMAIINEPPEVSLFDDRQGHYSIEAYINSARIAGLKAKMVFNVGLSQETLGKMFDRGARISTLGSGTHKVELSGEDLAAVKHAPIQVITYIPNISLDATMVKGRFGEPQARLREAKGQTVHWLYPKLGLDVALNPKEKAVLLYVMPREFERVEAPLRQSGVPVKE